MRRGGKNIKQKTKNQEQSKAEQVVIVIVEMREGGKVGDGEAIEVGEGAGVRRCREEGSIWREEEGIGN